MSLADIFLKEVTEEKTATDNFESNAQYFELMGKAAAHGYFDTINALVNEVKAEDAVDVVEKCAASVSPELHKVADGILNGEFDKEAFGLSDLKGMTLRGWRGAKGLASRGYGGAKGLASRGWGGAKGLASRGYGKFQDLSTTQKAILGALAAAGLAGGGYAAMRKPSKKKKKSKK